MRLPSVEYMHIQNNTVDVDPDQDEGYISYGGTVTAECMRGYTFNQITLEPVTVDLGE